MLWGSHTTGTFRGSWGCYTAGGAAQIPELGAGFWGGWHGEGAPLQEPSHCGRDVRALLRQLLQVPLGCFPGRLLFSKEFASTYRKQKARNPPIITQNSLLALVFQRSSSSLSVQCTALLLELLWQPEAFVPLKQVLIPRSSCPGLNKERHES